MQLRKSSHAVHKLGVHLIWCTKFRNPVLVLAVEVACKKILAETCAAHDWTVEAVDVMPDHVHVFVQHDQMTAVGTIAATLKSVSAAVLFSQFRHLKRRNFWATGLWSRSTYFGSVGEVNAETIRKYIDQQKKK